MHVSCNIEHMLSCSLKVVICLFSIDMLLKGPGDHSGGKAVLMLDKEGSHKKEDDEIDSGVIEVRESLTVTELTQPYY